MTGDRAAERKQRGRTRRGRCKLRDLMIKSVHIENFRCFKRLDLSDFGSINVVVGKNGSGKTALLESISLAGGGPELPGLFKGSRGVGGVPFQIQRTKSAYEALWKDLFFQFNSDVPIQIKLKGTPENARAIKIYYDKTSQAEVISQGPTGATGPTGPRNGITAGTSGFSGYSGKIDSSAITPLIFEMTDATGKAFSIRPEISEQGQLVLNPALRPTAPITFFYFATLLANPVWCANLFSNLSLRNEEPKLIATFCKVFGEISRIEVLSPDGMQGLYATIPGMSEKVPLGLVSGGMLKLIALLLAVSEYRNGAVLVDEFEDGFHYGIFSKVWESIIAFCKEYNVQLFASTHSAEFLATLAPLMKENSDLFRLLRAEEGKDAEQHIVKIFKGKDLEAALETGTEVR